jgi:hypothetical protein
VVNVDVDPGWRLVSTGFEGEPTDVRGVDPWSVMCAADGGRITVVHPSYPSQRHVMTVYEVAGLATPIRFAADEFSNVVVGFLRADMTAR